MVLCRIVRSLAVTGLDGCLPKADVAFGLWSQMRSFVWLKEHGGGSLKPRAPLCTFPVGTERLIRSDFYEDRVPSFPCTIVHDKNGSVMLRNGPPPDPSIAKYNMP